MLNRIPLTIVLVVVLFPGISLAKAPQGVVAQLGGFYTQDACANPSLGSLDLLPSCPAALGIVFTKTTFYYLEGICDDSGINHPTACGSRFTALAEETVGAGDITVNGLIQSTLSRGLNRICFDPQGVWDCTGAPGDANDVVIGTGKTLTQTRHAPAGVLSQAPAQATSEVIQLSARELVDPVDRKTKILKYPTTIAHITAEPNSGCGLGRTVSPGCGFVGTSVISLGLSEKK